VPEEFGAVGPAVIGQANRAIKYVSKHPPPDLRPRFSESAAVDRLRVRPKATSPGLSKELTGFHIDPLPLSAGGNGEYEGDEPRKRELSVSGEVFGGLLVCGVDFPGNNLKKFSCKVSKLA